MKKRTYDQDDKFFQSQFKKRKNYDPSNEERDLFKSWIKDLDTQNPHKNTKRTPPIEKTNLQKETYSTSSWDAGELFRNWMEHNGNKIHQYIGHKKEDKKITQANKPKQPDILSIDLHGYNRADALFYLKQFIKNLPIHVKKARIIHGKGLSLGKPSVIRTEIRSWLKYQKEMNSWLIDFSYETPENGGHGATVIWIKQGVYHEKY